MMRWKMDKNFTRQGCGNTFLSVGMYSYDKATIHLHGEATAIHSNGGDGIFAYSAGKVIIHLPSHHNTSYNNGKEDRLTFGGGTITNVED